jgi:anthranilate phosphoribosyltransferase
VANVEPEVLAQFRKTREVASEETYYHLLCSLRPDRLAAEDLAEIVRYIEATKQVAGDFPKHVNIFGTGGDGTINLSSMAAILASRFVSVVKMGTRAVTGSIGSSDFMAELKQRELDSPALAQTLAASRFRFLRLSEAGFAYREELRQARRRIHREGIPDLYKIVFPFANYTDPVVQINGAAKEIYFERFGELCGIMGRTACLVRSEAGIDELLPGRNRIAFFEKGVRSFDSEFLLLLEHAAGKVDRFRETGSPCAAVDLFTDLLEGRAEPLIRDTILQNAALVLACDSIINGIETEIDEAMSKHFSKLRALVP